METKGHSAPKSNMVVLRKLRTKVKKQHPLKFISASIIKKKKPETNSNKPIKAAAVKKKKENILKKLSNQLDFNNYKKIFCSTFSKFEPNNNSNSYKFNFHNFYTQVKVSTKDLHANDKADQERDNGMLDFFKTRKESVNLKTLEKTQKVFESTMDLLEKDPGFLDNFDVTKISNNIVNVGDSKIKLDQSRKIIQKYNLNREVYNANTNQKDESIEQLVFAKRLKMYETLKQGSNFSFDEIPYEIDFLHILDSHEVQHEEMNVESHPENSNSVVDFVNKANELIDKNMEVEEAFIDTLKESQLDHILKFNKKEEIEAFLKENNMTTANLNLDTIEDDKESQSLGWKIFKNLILENPEGGASQRIGIEIMGLKERFRTQKKNSDFFYYDTSLKKAISGEHDSKKTPRDKLEKHTPNKKKGLGSSQKSAANKHHTVFLSAEKKDGDDKSDSERHSSPIRRSRFESEDIKILKVAESLIDDYREVLQHTFKNLNAKDPNFMRQAIMQYEEIERKIHQQYPSTSESNATSNLKEQSDSYFLNLQTPQLEWNQLGKSVPLLTPSLNIPSFSNTADSSILTPPPLSVPALNNSSNGLSQPLLKSLDSGSSLSTSHTAASFHSVNSKAKGLENPSIPDLEIPGKTNDVTKKNTLLDNIINSEDTSNINYYNILNSMDVGSEKSKIPKKYSEDNIPDKGHKKNNIILTRNNS